MGDGISSASSVWQQSVQVEDGVEYEFSAWAASLYYSALPVMEFKVDGQVVGTLNTVNVTWEKFSASWTATSSGTIILSIRDTVTAGAGNDFAIDDIVFAEKQAVGAHEFKYDYRSSPTETTYHVFDGGLSVQEYAVPPVPGGQPTVEFIRGEGMGGGVGGMVYSIRKNASNEDEIKCSHANHRGDIIARSDSNGSLTSFALYEAYGTRPYEWNPSGDPDRQKANTKEEESDLNLLNEGMRYRDLETGTFLTRDPIGFADGPNIYCYVHCNPITNFDPFGLKVESWKGSWKESYINQTKLEKKYTDVGNKIPSGKDLRGFTLPTSSIFSGRTGRTLFVDGSLSIDVYISIDLSQVMQDKTSDHETVHVRETAASWNKMASKLNRLDGRSISPGFSASSVSKNTQKYARSMFNVLDKHVKESGDLFDGITDQRKSTERKKKRNKQHKEKGWMRQGDYDEQMKELDDDLEQKENEYKADKDKLDTKFESDMQDLEGEYESINESLDPE